jgi:hypothetical protein
MPTGICPLPLPEDKNLSYAAGRQGSLAVYFGLIQILTVGDGNVAESLNCGTRELEVKQLSTCGLKLSGGSQYVRFFWF